MKQVAEEGGEWLIAGMLMDVDGMVWNRIGGVWSRGGWMKREGLGSNLV